jgi:hypothetical protein
VQASLIKLETKMVEIPNYRPVWRELVMPSGVRLSANYAGMDTADITQDIKTVDYRVVKIAGGDNGENGYYLVNDDMWYTAMPLLKDIVDYNKRELERIVVDLKVENAYLTDVKRKYERTWWIKLTNYVKRLLVSLKKKA